MHTRRLYLLWTLLVHNLPLCSGHFPDPKNTEFVVAGYLPDYRFYINVNATARFLTDLILFSVDPRPSQANVLDGCCLAAHHYETARQARAFKQATANGTLTLWLTVGGGGRSEFFLQDLDRLTTTLIQKAKDEGLDGIDLDCESFSSQVAYERYLQWLREAAPIFRQAGLKVSVALHVSQFLYKDVYQLVDRIHLMAYDMPGGSYHGDLHTAQAAIDRLIQSGCPPGKIVLGIPAYARHSRNPGMVKMFAELVDDAPHGVELDVLGENDGYRGDSPRIVREKVVYTKEKGLAGIFFWELGQDKQHEHAGGGLLVEAASISRTFLGEPHTNDHEL